MTEVKKEQPIDPKPTATIPVFSDQQVREAMLRVTQKHREVFKLLKDR